MILTQLLSDARSQKDKAVLQSCILSDCLGREGGKEGGRGDREGGKGGREGGEGGREGRGRGRRGEAGTEMQV